MSIHLIKTSDEYESALIRINVLMDAKPGSKEETELDVLATLVEVYEEQNFPVDPSNLIAPL